MLKKALIFIICIALFLSVAFNTINVSAATIEKGIITVGTVNGNTGDTVIVPITITENPGICGVTISITYNSEALEYIEGIDGTVFYEAKPQEHPEKNIIRFVTAESSNRKNNGTVVSLKFKIAPKAKAGLHKIDISYRSGDFCNWKLDRIMPKIISGGVEVNLSQSNCPHKSYSEWTLAAIATCLENGAEQRSCKDCGHVELRDTKPIGHEYSKDYTIDKEATKTESGLMSRHCIRCAEYTDQISFTLKDSENGNIDNTLFNEIPKNDYIDNLHKEQYPEELTENEPQSSTSVIENNSSNETSSENDTTYIPDIDTEMQVEQITVLQKIAEVFPDIELVLKSVAKALMLLFGIFII